MGNIARQSQMFNVTFTITCGRTPTVVQRPLFSFPWRNMRSEGAYNDHFWQLVLHRLNIGRSLHSDNYKKPSNTVGHQDSHVKLQKFLNLWLLYHTIFHVPTRWWTRRQHTEIKIDVLEYVRVYTFNRRIRYVLLHVYSTYLHKLGIIH